MSARNFQRYLLSVQYNGKLFSGCSGHPSTKGKNPSILPSVQEVIETALEKFVTKSNFRDFQFSSRTDAGVHAFGNTFHVDIENRRRNTKEQMPPHGSLIVQRALNAYLAPKNIGITSVSQVPSTFHSRFDANNRTYMYRILVMPHKNPSWRNCLFEQDKSYILAPPKSSILNIDAMRAAAVPLLGNHDFTSFRNSGCQANSAVKTLDVLNIDERCWTALSPLPNDDMNAATSFDYFHGSSLGINAHVPGSSGNLEVGYGNREGEVVDNCFDNSNSGRIGAQEILITVRAKSFLYNQVRNIVGFLIDIGEDPGMNEIDAERKAIELLKKMDRNEAPKKVPAKGLYLMQVGYSDHII